MMRVLGKVAVILSVVFSANFAKADLNMEINWDSFTTYIDLTAVSGNISGTFSDPSGTHTITQTNYGPMIWVRVDEEYFSAERTVYADDTHIYVTYFGPFISGSQLDASVVIELATGEWEMTGTYGDVPFTLTTKVKTKKGELKRNFVLVWGDHVLAFHSDKQMGEGSCRGSVMSSFVQVATISCTSDGLLADRFFINPDYALVWMVNNFVTPESTNQ